MRDTSFVNWWKPHILALYFVYHTQQTWASLLSYKSLSKAAKPLATTVITFHTIFVNFIQEAFSFDSFEDATFQPFGVIFRKRQKGK